MRVGGNILFKLFSREGENQSKNVAKERLK